MFTGVIEGVGPRYCPSIEDKINRFADKDSHQIFLEPEGLTTHEFYPNGISTSLPFDVQLAAGAQMPGLENAHILRPGYAIEYDYFDPRESEGQLRDQVDRRPVLRRPDQRHHRLRGGGGAGPVGRRERRAAGAGRGCLVPRRDQAYLGVLVDDLITQRRDRALPHVHQPRRVPPAAARGQRRPAPDRDRPRELGLVDDARWDAFNRKRDAASRETERLKRPGSTPACCRRPTPSGCWARPSNTNTTWPTCCAGPASGFDGRGRWHGRHRPATAVFHVKHWRRTGRDAGRRRDRAGGDRHQVRRLHRQAGGRGGARRRTTST
jgi:tRNA uridine 5-carboxymethylaminomethyl modification enzyme